MFPFFSQFCGSLLCILKYSFSLKEWGPSCPHPFIDAFKLQQDMSWTPLEQVEKRDAELAVMAKLVSQQTCLPPVTGPNFNGLSD